MSHWRECSAIDPLDNYVLVANQQTDNIVFFKRDNDSGLLTKLANEIKVGNPVCLKFIK